MLFVLVYFSMIRCGWLVELWVMVSSEFMFRVFIWCLLRILVLVFLCLLVNFMFMLVR